VNCSIRNTVEELQSKVGEKKIDTRTVIKKIQDLISTTELLSSIPGINSPQACQTSISLINVLDLKKELIKSNS